jgi:hypothetical protein
VAIAGGPRWRRPLPTVVSEGLRIIMVSEAQPMPKASLAPEAAGQSGR